MCSIGNARSQIFEQDGDYQALERVIAETTDRIPVRILAYCIMPNHWHMVLWPTRDGDLGPFVQRMTTTHVRRWHLHRRTVGSGHLYQGTYKSFPIQDDEHFLTVYRYIEQNPLRAGLVGKAKDWHRSSLGRAKERSEVHRPKISEWPVPKPPNWVDFVNEAITAKELEQLRSSAQRGQPYGNENWQASIAERLGLKPTLNRRGRPQKSRI